MESNYATGWQTRAERVEKELAALREQLAQFRPPAIYCCSRVDRKHEETCRYSDKNFDAVAHLLHLRLRVATALLSIMDIAYEYIDSAELIAVRSSGRVPQIIKEMHHDLGKMGRFARWGQVADGSHLIYRLCEMAMNEGPESYETTVYRILARAGMALWILSAECDECGNVHPPGIHPLAGPQGGAWEYSGIELKVERGIGLKRGVWPPGLGPEG